MDQDLPAPTRKVRFAPKVPIRKAVKTEETKPEVVVEADAAQTRDLLRRINEGSGRGKPKAEKKSAPVQVAFGQGDSSNFMRSYGTSKVIASIPLGVASDGQGAEKDYKEPWDYYSYYPVTLPLRRPYSGDPVLLDEKEFAEDPANEINDESSIHSALELGMMDDNEDKKMLLFQLPTSLPLVKRLATAGANEMPDDSKSSKNISGSQKGCRLEDAPPGFMGKLLVYRSGKIKLKLGETLYDVSPGSGSVFAQDILAVNTEQKHCCVVGDPSGQRAIVTPDIDFALSSLADME